MVGRSGSRRHSWGVRVGKGVRDAKSPKGVKNGGFKKVSPTDRRVCESVEFQCFPSVTYTMPLVEMFIVD